MPDCHALWCKKKEKSRFSPLVCWYPDRRIAGQVLEFLGTSADCAAVNCAIVACEKGEHFRRTHAHA